MNINTKKYFLTNSLQFLLF